MRNSTLMAALAALLAACGDPDFAGGTPDVAGLTLETAGGPADGLPGAPLLSRNAAAVSATCQDWEYLCLVQEGVAGLNAFVRAAVEPVEQLVRLEPAAPTRRLRVFGPADLAVWGQPQPVASFRLAVLWVRDEVFRWRLDAKRLSDPDLPGSWTPVLAGQLTRGERAHRGRGVLGIDVDAFRAAVNDPLLVSGQGKLLAGFAHVGGHKALAYALRNFQATSTSAFVPAAVFVGHKLEGGPARVRLAGWNEFTPDAAGGPDAGLELLLSRAGWWPGVGGRAAVAVLGGDVPSYGQPGFAVDLFLAVGCYDATQAEGYRNLFACSYADTWPVADAWHGRHCVPVPLQAGDPRRFGSPGACLPGTEVYDDQDLPPPMTQDSGALEPGAPVAPEAPPTVMPDGAF
ncbi:MAG TPA: hypothetical protein VIV59_09200 [Anaeromyxobacteraceae bacterium]